MVIKQIRRVSLWDKDSINPLMSGIRVAPGSAEYEELGKQFTVTSSPNEDFCAIGLPMFTPSQPNTNLELKCSHCKASFTTRQEQVEHYRLDWHRCNLHRSVAGKAPLTEEQFANDLSDVSSISGSEEDNTDGEEDGDDDKKNIGEDDKKNIGDDDKKNIGDDDKKNIVDEELTDQVLGRQARMFFLNVDGLVISMYRAVLFDKKSQMIGEQDTVQRAQGVTMKPMWAVMLLGGGHFAAAIFNGSDVLIHKTFHNYTVRSKQGGNQSARDNQSGTSHPKSGGASLRRYNEMSQRQHIQELMESWKPHLARCNLIFYHAKNHNRSTLFSGKNALLNIQDSRLRTIPFPTKRAKFSEVKRVYGLLSEIFVHGTEEEFRGMIKESTDKESKPMVRKKKDSSPSKKPVRKPKSERKDSPVHFSSSSEESEDSEGDIVLMTTMMTISTTDLGGGGGSECSVNIDKKRRQTKKKKVSNSANRDSSNKKGNHPKSKVYDVLYTACRTGNIGNLSTLLQKHPGQQSEESAISKELIELAEREVLPENLSQITFGAQQKTMLHIAAENNQKDIIWWLMDNGCDPSVSDHQGLLPFDSSKTKDTRNHFRRFRAQHPEKFDFEKAKVPAPLTPEQEDEQAALQVMRKKAKRQAQKEKEKKRQLEEKDRKKEEEDKTRFLELSDREKRALAAERRLLQQCEQAGAPNQVLQRCFSCAGDITGMVPFEYSEFKFCSTKCVREHRSKKT